MAPSPKVGQAPTSNLSNNIDTTKGYDEGGFAGAKSLNSFLADFGLTDAQWTGSASALADRKANISSFGVLGAAIGSIFALALTDRIGRLRTWQFFSALWMTGIFMTTFSSGILGLMLFSRICSGLGAGGLTVVAPLYLSEIAPAKSRGMVVSIYMVVLLTMLMLGKPISPTVFETANRLHKVSSSTMARTRPCPQHLHSTEL